MTLYYTNNFFAYFQKNFINYYLFFNIYYLTKKWN